MAPRETLASSSRTCASCGKTEPWRPGWRFPHIVGDYFDERVGKAVCSDACEEKLLAPSAVDHPKERDPLA